MGCEQKSIQPLFDLFPLDLFPLDLFPLFPLDLFPLDLFPLVRPVPEAEAALASSSSNSQ